MAFQRKKPAAIGVKAAFPGFIEPALASAIHRRALHLVAIGLGTASHGARYVNRATMSNDAVVPWLGTVLPSV